MAEFRHQEYRKPVTESGASSGDATGADGRLPAVYPECRDLAPPGWRGHWREWHRGHGCHLDPGAPQPRTIEPKLMSAESLAEDRRYLERYGLDPCDIEYRLLAHIAALENQLDGLGYWQANCEDARAMRDVAINERDAALIRVNELEDALGDACGDMPDGEQHDRLYGVLARKQR